MAVDVLIFFGISMLLLGFEEAIKQHFDLSSLLAVMVMGMVVLLKIPEKAKCISKGYEGI